MFLTVIHPEIHFNFLQLRTFLLSKYSYRLTFPFNSFPLKMKQSSVVCNPHISISMHGATCFQNNFQRTQISIKALPILVTSIRKNFPNSKNSWKRILFLQLSRNFRNFSDIPKCWFKDSQLSEICSNSASWKRNFEFSEIRHFSNFSNFSSFLLSIVLAYRRTRWVKSRHCIWQSVTLNFWTPFCNSHQKTATRTTTQVTT